MLEVRIRPASYQDLPALIAALGQEHHFRNCLARQDAGRGVLLMASIANAPVGDMFLRLEPAEEPELRDRLPGVPLLQHLEVHPSRRDRLIGTQLLGFAERLLREAHGADRVALGVGLDSGDAIRLYQRQGYREWPYPPIATTRVEYEADGTPRFSPDRCQIMVKDLRGTGGVVPRQRALDDPLESTVDE
jgi:ribosomal protein S18 acetylase RimI-like enzyme